jgi:hypothetical protein
MANIPYSPDLPLHHLCFPLKEASRGRRLTSDQDVKEAAHARLAAQSNTFLSKGIRKLVQRQTKCGEEKRTYVQKRSQCKFLLIRNKITATLRKIIDLSTYINMDST